MNKKTLLSLSLAALVSVSAACSNGEEAAKEPEKETQTQAQQEQPAENKDNKDSNDKKADQPKMPEPDLEGVPDVVAVVNGEDIQKKEFEDVYMGQFQKASIQSQMTGQQVNQEQLRKQVVEGMIGQELLIQKANNGNYKASQEEVNKVINGIVEKNGLESKQALMDALEKQGMKKEELMSQLETQVKVNQLITSEVGEIKVTDQELQQAYEQRKALQAQMGGQNGEKAKTPSFEEMKPQLKEQVKGQKKSEATQKLVAELREDADVTINL